MTILFDEAKNIVQINLNLTDGVFYDTIRYKIKIITGVTL